MDWAILKALLSSPVIQRQIATAAAASLATSYACDVPLTGSAPLLSLALSAAIPFGVLYGGQVEVAEHPIMMPLAAAALTYVLVKVL